MEQIAHLPALRARIAGWRQDGARIAFVPTMGSLHDGHLSLAAVARQHADRVVASVFVNPTQFGPGEDFERYPRDADGDATLLADAGCDLMWSPGVSDVYPFGLDGAVRMQVPGISDLLEGAHRPGHFDGVVTVVTRLFHHVQPDLAVFGRKDFQQFMVIRRLVEDLAFPIELIGADTVREPDGLALSSRNRYLSDDERAVAPELHRTLEAMREWSIEGIADVQIEALAAARLTDAGFDVDYATVRTPDLELATSAADPQRVALAAARLGGTRLIDNVEFSLPT